MTRWHLLNQKQMISGRATQAFPHLPSLFSNSDQKKKKIINKPCSIKLCSNFQVGFKAGWGCVSEVGISCRSPRHRCEKIPSTSRSVTVQKWTACCQKKSPFQRMTVLNTSTRYTQNQLPTLSFNSWFPRQFPIPEKPATSQIFKPILCDKASPN